MAKNPLEESNIVSNGGAQPFNPLNDLNKFGSPIKEGARTGGLIPQGGLPPAEPLPSIEPITPKPITPEPITPELSPPVNPFSTGLLGEQPSLGSVFGDKQIADKYKDFFADYDPTKEQFATKQFFSQQQAFQRQGGQALERLMSNQRQLQSKFAGSGAAEQQKRSGFQTLRREGDRQIGLLNLGREREVFGLRQDFKERTFDTATDILKSDGDPFQAQSTPGRMQDRGGDEYFGNRSSDEAGQGSTDQRGFAGAGGIPPDVWNGMTDEQKQLVIEKMGK